MQRLGSRLRRVAFISFPVVTASIAWYSYPSIRELMTYQKLSKSFEVPLRVRGPDGKSIVKMHTLPRLSEPDVDAKLREHAYGQTVRRRDGISMCYCLLQTACSYIYVTLAWKYQTAFLAANDGMEDAYAQALVERDITPDAPPGELLFFAVCANSHHFSCI